MVFSTPYRCILTFLFSIFFSLENPNRGLCSDIKTAPLSVKPVAVNDTVSTMRNKRVLFKPTANDKINGTLQVLGIVSQPRHGSIAFQSVDTLIYMPIPNYCGARDTLMYFICNGENSCDTATIYIDIACGNVSVFAPVAANDFVNTSKNLPVVFTPSVNDRLNGNLLAIGIARAPKNGSISFLSVDSIKYVPLPDFCGKDTLTYRICNDKEECDTALVFINVFCEIQPANVPIVVTFRVKMDTVKATSVQLVGDFQKDAGFANNWNEKTIKMQGPINNYYIYTDTILNKIYQYKFLKNNAWIDSITGASFAEQSRFDVLGCGIANSTGIANRLLDLTVFKQPFTKVLITQDWNKCAATIQTALNVATSALPTEGGKTTGNGLYFTGDTAVLRATVNPGFKFFNWTNNGAIISTDSVFKYAVTNVSVNLVANFRSTSAVKELPNETFSISPNPTKGQFRILLDYDNIMTINPSNVLNKLSVLNVLGKMILTINVSNRQKDVLIDMTTQPKGIYFIHMQTPAGQLTKKLIIE